MASPGPLREEPRGMTLADLVAAVVGSAVGLAVLRGVGLFEVASYPGRVRAVVIGLRVGLVGSFALSTVTLARRGRFGGAIRPTDWLAILPATFLVEYLFPPGLDFGGWLASKLHVPFAAMSWIVRGGAVLIALVAASLAAALVRRKRGGAFPLLVLAVGVSAIHWAATDLAFFEGLRLFRPVVASLSRIFDSRPSDYFYNEALLAMARLPEGVFRGVPTVATLLAILRGRGRSWAWSDWASAATGPATWASVIVVSRSFVPLTSTDGIVFAAYVATSAALSMLVVALLGPLWTRLFAPGHDEGRTSPAPPLRLSPADHGRTMTLEECADAEEAEGYRDELARGGLEVTEVPAEKGPGYGRYAGEATAAPAEAAE